MAQRLITRFFTFFVLIPLLFISCAIVGIVGYQIAYETLRNTGVIRDEILIAGTGSMYPTFPKGEGESDIARFHEVVAGSSMRLYPGGITIGPYHFWEYQLQHGDIVSFSNGVTDKISEDKYGEKAGLVKRIIGLPNDHIELRNGFVVRNGEVLKEPYTARSRSTYGGAYVSDCQQFVVPDGSVFVLGDNRIASSDSRGEIGLVKLTDIDHVLPFAAQGAFYARWRDATNDLVHADTVTFDAQLYERLLNDKRQAVGVARLSENSNLTQSAKKRGLVVLSTGDLSFEATASGYPMQKAIAESGYSNVLLGESPFVGFLTAEELLEASFEDSKTREFLLNPDYNDIGVTAVLGEMNSCPTQIIVQHFGGYIPPTYTQVELDSWEQAAKSVHDAIPSWEDAKKFEPFYTAHREDLDQLLKLLNRRAHITQTILGKMKSLQWLTEDDQKMAQEDTQIAQEANALIEKLNQ